MPPRLTPFFSARRPPLVGEGRRSSHGSPRGGRRASASRPTSPGTDGRLADGRLAGVDVGFRRFVAAVVLVLLAVAATGWRPGQIAAGTRDALAPVDPRTLEVPTTIAEGITGPTALFYFSPVCPHCQAVMPEIEAIVGPSGIPWRAVAIGSATASALETFKVEHHLTMPVVVDTDRAFAQAVSARSTPAVYIVGPSTRTASSPGMRAIDVLEAYVPFSRGVGAVLLLRRDTTRPFAHFQGYQGPTVCVMCHEQEGMAWALTHHAAAWRTLARRDRAQDLACVGCHVTGMGSGGFDPNDTHSALKDVTCEACHGPSGPHDGERTDARTTCVACHDAEHSIAFDLERALPHIDHYAANDLSEAAFQDRLSRLAKGEAERPLLAFPEGDTLGSAACKACHKNEAKAWSKDVHAHAMDRLQGDERTNPECVSCHATPRASGLGAARSSADHFRTDESVGCESCHGSGVDHATAPSKTNIVGLGKSCPECIIEGICTSCHTRRWDPTWQLQPRLDAMKH